MYKSLSCLEIKKEFRAGHNGEHLAPAVISVETLLFLHPAPPPLNLIEVSPIMVMNNNRPGNATDLCVLLFDN